MFLRLKVSEANGVRYVMVPLHTAHDRAMVGQASMIMGRSYLCLADQDRSRATPYQPRYP
jgi:hypothetical protein